ncbi:MAG: hypothetical protein AAGB24_05775 [Bacteroidota bacterium]
MESLANLANERQLKTHGKSTKNDVNYCRTCYDHLAGHTGVLIVDKLISKAAILWNDKTFMVTESRKEFFCNFDLELTELQKQRRHFAKACLDYSERKYHIACALGAALLNRM